MKRDKTKNKDAMISFRTNDDFKEGLVKIAKTCGLSIGEVVKQCVFGYYKQLIKDTTTQTQVNVSKESTDN